MECYKLQMKCYKIPIHQEISYQGYFSKGVLSPLLLLQMINNVLIDLERNGTNVVSYTDDVLIAGKFLQTSSDLIQGALVKLSRCQQSSGPESTHSIYHQIYGSSVMQDCFSSNFAGSLATATMAMSRQMNWLDVALSQLFQRLRAR